MSSLYVEIIVLVILIICSGLVSASEVALFSLSPKDKVKLKYSEGKKSKTILGLLSNPGLLLGTILIANNFLNVTIILLSTYLSSVYFVGMLSPAWLLVIELIVITFVLLLFAEMLPKILAERAPLKTAELMAYPLLFAQKLFYPISIFLIKSTNVVNKRIAARRTEELSVQNLSEAVKLASEDLKEDKDVLEGFLQSRSLDVKEIMTSRVDVKTIDYKDKFSEVLKKINANKFSRLPVCVDNLDNIKGVLYIKDTIPFLSISNKAAFKWQKLIRPHYIVPESKRIHDLLFDFQEKKIHFALVVDEYGGVSGIVTLEDIMEEFVGEIQDESNLDRKNFVKIDDNTYEFDAKTSLVDFCKEIDENYALFQDVKGESDSLAGLILEINGEMPKVNSKILIKNYEFTILEADYRKIRKIKLTIPPKNDDAE